MQVTKIYCISTDDCEHLYHQLTDEEFIAEAEKHGDTFDLDTFANAFNQSDVNTNNDIIRIVTTETVSPRDQRIIEDIERNLATVNEQIKQGVEKSFTIGWMISALNNIKTIISPS